MGAKTTLPAITKLKESPLFNLSLSSQELFHSNFLYWIANNYKKEFGELFAPYLKEMPNDLTIKNIYREKKNIDLSFTYSNGQEVFIENKVKSMPYIRQLENYSEKNPKYNYILLSLSKPSFFDDVDNDGKQSSIIEIDGVEWQYLSYTVLRNMLAELSAKIKDKVNINEKGKYHFQVINDYCTFIDGLIEVNDYCDLKSDDVFNFHSIKEDEIYKQLESIRIHDFYLKKKYELLAYEVYKELKNRGKYLTPFSAHLDWKNAKPNTIYMNYGMTRSQGIMDLKYFISKDVLLGIQIQGEHYRMVVEDNDNITADKLKDKLNSEENKLWFNFASFPEDFASTKVVYPIIKDKIFNQFGKNFFYKSIKLGISLTIGELVDIILKDVEHIEDKYDEIME